MNQLEMLIGALQHDVITPQQGLAQLMAYDEERKAKRAERAEQQRVSQDVLTEALLGAQSAAYSAASKGTPLSQFMVSPEAQGLPPDLLTGLLAPYYHAPDNPDSGNFGISRINPTLPQDADGDIFSIVRDEWASGNRTPANITAVVGDALGYGPNVSAALGTQIATKVQEAIKAVRGF